MEVLVSKNAYNGYDLYREESNGTTYYSLGLPEKGESEVDMTVGWYSKDGFSFYFYMENIGPLTDGEEKAFAEGKKTFYQLVAETGDIDAALVGQILPKKGSRVGGSNHSCGRLVNP